jgi:hypothetical protein
LNSLYLLFWLGGQGSGMIHPAAHPGSVQPIPDRIIKNHLLVVYSFLIWELFKNKFLRSAIQNPPGLAVYSDINHPSKPPHSLSSPKGKDRLQTQAAFPRIKKGVAI